MIKKNYNLVGVILVVVYLFSFILASTAMPKVNAEANVQIFSDVPNEHWASKYINRLASPPLNIILGKGDGTFGLMLNATRAEFATFMVRALKMNTDIPYQGTFSDVTEDKWYSQYVEAAYNAEIIRGKGDGIFEPEANITRQEVTTVVANTIAVNEKSTVSELAKDIDLNIVDAGDVSEWAIDGLKVCYKFGFIQGYPGNTFRPQNFITRAEIATILSIYIDYTETLITPTATVILTETPTPTATAIPTETPTPTPSPVPALTPEAPRVFIDTTYLEPTGDIITVNDGDNLQAAINAANPGDIIEIEAGAEFIGNYTLPNKIGDDWIYIRSSAYSNLPNPGIRVSMEDAINMPKIITVNSSPALTFPSYSHHYRLIGIEVATTNDNIVDKVFQLIQMGGNESTLEAVPHNLVIDRCYIHGTTTGNLIRGVAMNGAYCSVIDSYISECHDIINDAQAICGWNGPGPYKIVNNYLAGAGENIMFGGGDTQIPNLSPSDIEVRGNYMFKPLYWNESDPSYIGIRWCVKNTFELKHAKRVIVEGNILENNWIAADQQAYSVVFTPRNQSGGNNWLAITDVLFTNNIIKNSDRALYIMGTDNNYPTELTERIEVSNNVFENIAAKVVGAHSIGLTRGGADIVINHNNLFQKDAILFVNGTIERFAFTNNITHHKGFGIGSSSLTGDKLIDNYFPGGTFTKNIIAGGKTNTFIKYTGNYFNPPASLEDVGFVDFAGGNYRLSESSLYKYQGTDGKDIGADIDAIEAATAMTILGR